MRNRFLQITTAILATVLPCAALPKPHLISFGKLTTVKWNPEGAKPFDLRVRALYVDTRLKEYTTGPTHDVTDRLFVVRRAFRLNDSLPAENAAAPRWQWQRGGWLLVDRLTGRVSQIVLPEFDAFSSQAIWYRDYVAYCGVSEDGQKLYAIVAQLGRRKPILHKALGETSGGAEPDSECSPPEWQRAPVRVTFDPGDQKVTFTVRGRVVDLVSDEEE